MSALNNALHQVGVDLGVDAGSNLIGAIGEFNRQNLSPSDLALANSGLRILSQATGIGALSPGVVSRGVAGEWESLHYADDLNNHHPKFKFLFKVNFNGFPGGNFSYYVHRCDKPKVKFQHTEVNYYNFRTKVLTSTVFDPLSFTFLDEIGNTVNSFFALYTAARSNQGNGKASIQGGEEYSSTIPYKNGFSAGRTVEIQQIFGNGAATNIFTLINARIDSMDFDELNMELTAGSMMTCTVSYDAISCRTTGPTRINAWGNTDVYAGGGKDATNAGSSSTEVGRQTSANGGGIGGQSNFLDSQSQSLYSSAINGLSSLKVPDSLSRAASSVFNQPDIVKSTGDFLSRNLQGTIGFMMSGDNLKFGGSDNYRTEGLNHSAETNNVYYSNEGNNHSAETNNPDYSNEGRAYSTGLNNPDYGNENRRNPINPTFTSGGGGDFGGGGSTTEW